MSKKPVLYWGVVRSDFMSFGDYYRVIRVTRDSGHQISGVRVGDIGAVTLRSSALVGRYESQDAAEGAIKHVGQVRAPYQAELAELSRQERSIREKRNAHEKKVFAEYPGSLNKPAVDA